MRSAVVLLGLLLGGGVLAQESDSFNLSEHTFNAGGSPQDGAVLTSRNFQLSLSAIGQGVTPAALASASFSMSGGFVGTYPPPGSSICSRSVSTRASPSIALAVRACLGPSLTERIPNASR